MVVVVVAANYYVLDSAVHALDLAVGPGMVGLDKPVLDAVAIADTVERVTAEPGGRPQTIF